MGETITIPVNSAVKGKPYPGLRSFKPDEADLFFGREEQVDQLLEKLDDSHFVAVVGPSGCGKSSLVRAGLIPALKTGFLAEAGARWKIVEMRPSNQPFYNLAQAVHNSFQYDTPVEFLKAELRRGPKSLIDIVRHGDLRPHENVLILVDQFEELFRFRQNNNIEEVTAFINLLIASAQQNEVSLHVVITMRSDYLGECSLFYDLPEILNDNQFLTPRLTREQCRKAIVGPASVCGGVIDPELVNTLLNDLGVEHDQLPLLQHALMRTWNLKAKEMQASSSGNGQRVRLTIDDYETVGRVSDALSRHINEVYNSLDDAQKIVAEKMFKRLSDRNAEKKPIRRPSSVREIADVANVSVAEVIEVANRFRAETYNFLMPDEVSLHADSMLDISHESLMRQWDKLKKWMEEEEDSARKYRWLSDAVRFNSGYLRGLDLKNALDWQKTQDPNHVWSERYSDNLDGVVNYINKSKVTSRNNKFKRYGLLLLLLTSISFAAYTTNRMYKVRLSGKADRQILEEQTRFQKDSADQMRKQLYIQDSLTVSLKKTNKDLKDTVHRLEITSQELIEKSEELKIKNNELERLNRKVEYTFWFNASHFNQCKRVDSVTKSNGYNFLMSFLNRDDSLGFMDKLSAFDLMAEALDTAAMDPYDALEIIKKIWKDHQDSVVKSMALKIINNNFFVKQEFRPLYKEDTYHTTAFAFSKNRKKFIYNVEGNVVHGTVLNSDSLVISDTAKHEKSPHITSLAFIDDNETIARVKKKLIYTQSEKQTDIRLPVDSTAYCKLSPDGSLLFTYDNNVGALWKIANLKKSVRVSVALKDMRELYAVAFSPDGRYFVTGHKNECVLWDTNGRRLQALTITPSEDTYSNIITALNFSPDCNTVFIGVYNKDIYAEIKIWDIKSNKTHQSIPLRLSEVTRLNISPDGRKILAGSGKDPYIIYINMDAPKAEFRTIEDKDTLFIYTDFLNNSTIISGDYYGNIRVWAVFPEFRDVNKAFDILNISQNGNGDYNSLLYSDNPKTLQLAARYFYSRADNDKDYLNKARQLLIKLEKASSEKMSAPDLYMLIDINDRLNEVDSQNHFGISERIKQNITIRRRMLEIDSSSKSGKIRMLSTEYANLVWAQLHIKDFQGAFLSSQKAIELDSGNELAVTRSALAYLFTEQFEKAEDIYRNYKGKAYPSKPFVLYNKIFLGDLKKLEDDEILEPGTAVYQRLGLIRILLRQ